MNCGELDLALIKDPNDATLPLPLQQHLATCLRCRQLLTAMSSAAAFDPQSEDNLRQIEKRLVADLKPVRPLPASPKIAAAFVLIIVSILAILFGVFRMGAYGVEAMSMSQASLVLSALVLSVGLLADSLSRQMVPGRRHLLHPAALPLGIALMLVAVVGTAFAFEPDDRFLANSWICLRIGTVIGGCAALPFWLVLRQGAPLSRATTGAAAGLLAGLVGTSALQLHCPNLDMWHILLSHVGSALLWALTGVLAARALEFMADTRNRVKR